MATKKVTRKRKTAAKRKSTTRRKTTAKRKSTTKRKTTAKRKTTVKPKTAKKKKSSKKPKSSTKKTKARALQKLRKGFNTKFLGGINIPFPQLFNESIKKDALKNPNHKLNGEKKYVWDYINYSLAMSKSGRLAFYSICNLDKKLREEGIDDIKFSTDKRIDVKYQLNDDYYYCNPWDRGHLTRRAAVAWGKNRKDAEKSSDDSYSYTNVSPQHKNFNRDEWVKLEDYVLKKLARAQGGLVSIITGPVFLFPPKTLYPKRKSKKAKPAHVPSGFWKIIYYIDTIKTDKYDEPTLGCEAYLIWQDKSTITQKSRSFDPSVYQVTTTYIEDLTGIKFDKKLHHANVLWYYTNPDRDIKEPEKYLVKMAGKSKNMTKGWPIHVIHDRYDIIKHKFERTSR